MNYAEMLAGRPFDTGGGAAMGAPMAENPYSRLMQNTMQDISTFRNNFPRSGGDGMRPQQQQQNSMRRTPPVGSGQPSYAEQNPTQRAQRPTSNIVRSTF